MNEKRVFSVLVNNHFGVLTRVAGLFARRGYNIDSLTVGTTEDPKYSRMTIVACGSAAVFEQVKKQLDKLIDVIHIEVLTPEESLIRQLMFFKVRADGKTQDAVKEVADDFEAKVVDKTENSITLEAAGYAEKLKNLQAKLGAFGIIEMVQTGMTGIAKGDQTLIDKKKHAEKSAKERA